MLIRTTSLSKSGSKLIQLVKSTDDPAYLKELRSTKPTCVVGDRNLLKSGPKPGQAGDEFDADGATIGCEVQLLDQCGPNQPEIAVDMVKAHSQLKLIGLLSLLMRFAEHPGCRDSDRFSGPA
jgi:hypothetical protein